MEIKDMISARARGIVASGIRRLFDLGAKLECPVDLSIGQPDFDVPEPLKEAAINAIRAGKNSYTPSAGIAPLREALLENARKRYGHQAEACLVTSGTSGGLTLAFLALLDPGDEVLIPDPFFVSYRELATIAGAKAVGYDLYDSRFRLDLEALERARSPRTKAVVVNSPANPTGAVFSRPELEALVAFCRRHGLGLISDEVYNRFTYDVAFVSVGALAPEALVLNGCSKAYAMTGWRIGWALGPQELIETMIKVQQFTFVNATTPAQYAALAALDYDVSVAVAKYRQKRDFLCRRLHEAGYEFSPPAGAFYVFPRLPAGYEDDLVFAERALERNLLLVPGSAFSFRKTHFRLSFSAAAATLERGSAILAELASGWRP